MSPERTFWLSQAGLFAGNLLIVFGVETRDLALWELAVTAGLGVWCLVAVVYAVQERERGVPAYFREWTGWQRMACTGSGTVFALGVLTAVFA